MTVRNQSINLPGFMSGTAYGDGTDTDSIVLSELQGVGSTDDATTRWSSGSGTDTYTVTSTAAAGTTVKIARSGIYIAQLNIHLTELVTAGDITVGISVDGISTDPFTLASAGIRDFHVAGGTGETTTSGRATAIIVVSDADAANASAAIVRGLLTGGGPSSDTTSSFRFTRFANFQG